MTSIRQKNRVRSIKFRCHFFLFRQVKFHGQSTSGGNKRVASEEIIEIEDLAKRSRDDDGDGNNSTNDAPAKTLPTDEIVRKPTELTIKFAKPMNISVGAMSNGRNAMKNLVKRKPVETATPASAAISSTITSTVVSSAATSRLDSVENKINTTSNSTPTPSGLSLLAGYEDDSTGSDDSD